MNDTVTITTEGNHIRLSAPYKPETSPEARKIGGRWSKSDQTWVFDVRDIERVRALALKLFGTDGSDNDLPGVTVRANLGKLAAGGPWIQVLRLAGRLIAERPHRDAPVRLAPGVVLVDGEFENSGGSNANPTLGVLHDIVVEVRDLPRDTAAKVIAEYPDAVTLHNPDEIDPLALRAERRTLLARLAEIDALLAATGNPTD